MDIIRIILKIVIHPGRQRIHAVRDHIINLDLELILGQIQVEAIAQRTDYSSATLLETWQVRAQLHDLNDWHQFVHMLTRRKEAFKHKYFEVGKHVTLLAAHHLNELCCHLEGRTLEAQVLG